MSDDNSKDSSRNQQASQPSATASQPHQEEDIFASVRRFADEQISAALHSVFGIPSILQPPSSSNWIIEDTDRNSNSRFEDMSRREGSDESRNSSGDDNEGNNGSGSGVSGFGGNSGSSGSQGSPSSGSSSNRGRKDDDDDEFRPPALWTPTISQLLLSLGLHSTALLEKNFGHFHKEFRRLLEQEYENQKNTSHATEELIKREARTSETVIIKGTQTGAEEPKFTVTKFSGQPSSSILKELFGEDMYGSNRTYPLFTSLFDEFLPDGQYNKQQPPSPVGGRRLPGETSESVLFPFPSDPVESFFRMMVGPTLKRLEESADPTFNDEMRNQADIMLKDVFNGQHDSIAVQEQLKKLHEDRAARQEEFMKKFQERRITEDEEMMNEIKKRREAIARLMKMRESTEDTEHRHQIQSSTKGKYQPESEPETELDLYNYFASPAAEKHDQNDKVVVSQSTTTTSTTDSAGITRTKKIRERRYSDGSVEREEHDEESQGQQRAPSAAKEGWGGWGEYGFPHGLGHRKEELRRAFAAERDKAEAGHATTISKVSATDNEQNSVAKDGGWGSWFWASGKK